MRDYNRHTEPTRVESTFWFIWLVLQEKTKEYGQELFEKAEFLSRNITNIDATLKKLVSTFSKLSKNGLEKLIKKNKLDAVVAPDLSFVLAIGQYPGISVPAGYDSDGVPFGICFGGPKGSEPKLIEIAYGFETATKVRRPPAFKPWKLSEIPSRLVLMLIKYLPVQ